MADTPIILCNRKQAKKELQKFIIWIIDEYHDYIIYEIVCRHHIDFDRNFYIYNE